MSIVVLDASVIVKTLLPQERQEADTDRAIALWSHIADGTVQLVQPVHWIAEVAAVLARLSPESAEQDVRHLIAMEATVLDHPVIYETACRLSIELDHHLFDTLYHAVALELDDAELVTADNRYLSKAKHIGRVRAL